MKKHVWWEDDTLENKVGIAVAHELDPSFMDQGCGLESMSGSFPCHFLGRNPFQLGVNQRQQLLSALLIAVPDLPHEPFEVRLGIAVLTLVKKAGGGEQQRLSSGFGGWEFLDHLQVGGSGIGP